MIFNRLFTNYLIEKQILSEELATEWLERSDAAGSPLHLELYKGGIVEEESLYRMLAEFLGYEYRFCQLSEINLSFFPPYVKSSRNSSIRNGLQPKIVRTSPCNEKGIPWYSINRSLGYCLTNSKLISESWQ